MLFGGTLVFPIVSVFYPIILLMDFSYTCYREHTCNYGINFILVLVFISFLENILYKNVK
jgi:hypothetical protein